MKSIYCLIAILLIGGMSPLIANGQMVKNGGPKGVAAFGAADIPVTSSATVYTDPADRHFLILTFCNEAVDMSLQGSTVGKIIDPGQFGNQSKCLSFPNGIAVPPGEVLNCVNNETTGTDNNCLVTGVLTKR